jgi:uncharacterized protein DUF1064
MRRAAKVDAMRRASKYGAKRTEVDGIVFASQKEARRYQELRLLERAGRIRGLILQPRYDLFAMPASRDPVKVGAYVGDFQYERRSGPEWATVVEDVKGFKTPLYRFKKKFVEAQHGITVVEV